MQITLYILDKLDQLMAKVVFYLIVDLVFSRFSHKLEICIRDYYAKSNPFTSCHVTGHHWRTTRLKIKKNLRSTFSDAPFYWQRGNTAGIWPNIRKQSRKHRRTIKTASFPIWVRWFGSVIISSVKFPRSAKRNLDNRTNCSGAESGMNFTEMVTRNSNF